MTAKRSREYDVTFSQSDTGMPVVLFRNKEYFWRISNQRFEMLSNHSAFSHLIYFNEENQAVIRVIDMQKDVIVCHGDELIENGINRSINDVD
jgi:hypothetical protein